MSQAIQALDTATIRSLHSGQVVTEIESIVKELVENALDAGATNIEVKIVNNGLQSIHVKDNGSGIKEEDRAMMARKHYTSKICSFNDLESLKTFGFRGEALSAICAVAETLQLTTKTRQDKIAKQYDLDKEGSHKSEKPSASISREGTLVVLTNPFHNLPVRRQIAQKTAAASVKRMHELLVKYGLSHPAVRFMLLQTSDTLGSRNKDQRWIKPNVSNTLEAITTMYDRQLAEMLETHVVEGEEKLRLECVLPKKKDIDPSIIYRGDRVFIYVNQRPVNYIRSGLKDLVSLAKNRLREILGLADDESFAKKTPFIYINIIIPAAAYDVNIEPDKSVVMFHYKQRIINLYEELLENVYGSPFKIPSIGNRSLSEPKRLETLETANEEMSTSLSIATSDTITGNDTSDVQDMQVKEQNAKTAVEEANAGASVDKEVQNSHGGDQSSAWIFDMYNQDASDGEEESVDDRGLLQSYATDTTLRQVSTLEAWFNKSISNLPSTIAQDVSSDVNGQQEHQIVPVTTTDTSRMSPESSSSSNHFLRNEMSWQIDNGNSSSLSRSKEYISGQPENEKSPVPPAKTLQYHHIVNRGEKRTADHGIWHREKRPRCQVEEAVDQDRNNSSSSAVTREMQHRVSSISPTTSSSFEIGAPGRPSTHSSRDEIPTSSSTTARQTNLQCANEPLGNKTSNKNKTLLEPRSNTVISNKPRSAALFLGRPTSTRDTLNMETTVPVDTQRIFLNYKRQRPNLLQNLSHWSAHELLKKEYKDPTRSSMTIHGLDEGLALYSMLSSSGRDQNALKRSIGAVDLKNARRAFKYFQYMKEKQLVCKKPLRQPIQVELGPLDPLRPLIQSLENRKEEILDDGHGCINTMYHVVTDARVIFNGFQCRWRKETDHVIIVQITGICDLGTIFTYSIHDFRELLLLLLTSNDDASTDANDMSRIRPVQVAKYFKHLVEQGWPQKETDMTIVLKTLDEKLEWKEAMIAEYPVVVGFAKLGPENEHIAAACKLL